MSYSVRKREKLYLAVTMLAIAAFAMGAPPIYALSIVAMVLIVAIIDYVVSSLRNRRRE